jgi:hypothetical protein
MASSNPGSSGNAIITVRPDPPSPELIKIITHGHYATNAERKKKYYLMIINKLSQQAGNHGIPYGIIKQLTTTMGKLGKADQLPNLISILEEYRSRVGMAPLALGGSRKHRSTRRRLPHRSKATKKRRSQ